MSKPHPKLSHIAALELSLQSGKKSIEQLRPSAPQQTSALELLEVYRFRILLVYPCALYYGMLILSRALGACPTSPGFELQRTVTVPMSDHSHKQIKEQ